MCWFAVYKTPCACAAYYIGHTGRSVTVRHKDHQSHLKSEHVDKLVLVDHGWKMGYSILFDQMEILYKSDQWGPKVTRESVELLLAQNALNKEDGTKLSAAWLPVCELHKGKHSTTC